MSLNEKEINRMCEKMSWRLSMPNNRQDVKQEGLLAVYDLISKSTKELHPAELYRAAKKSMFTYNNMSTLPVSMPDSRDVQEIVRSGKVSKYNHLSEANVEWTLNIVKANHTPFDDTVMQSDADQAKDLEDKNYAEYILSTALTSLTRTEYHVIKLKYYDDQTTEDIAKGLGISQQYVSILEKNALLTLRTELENPV
jgi:RNA polymerase sigma factor (sigma-70 family)